MRGRDVICVSTHYWDERWFRKQEFMSRFARENRVLFVEPSVSSLRAPEPHLADVATNRLLRPQLESRGENVHLLKPPRGLPGWTRPSVERVNYRWFGRVVARAARRLGFEDPILWTHRTSFIHALDAVPHSHLVFDMVDDWVAYEAEGTPRRAHVEWCVNALTERCDLLVVTAKTLLDTYGPRARNAVQVSNGFDDRTFDPERAGEPPADLNDIPRPRLGLIGTLFTFLDFDLLEELARTHRDKSLVLVGPVEPTAAHLVESLVAHPNVHHLGPRPQAEIPAYAAAFDVCLNPFKPGRAADSVNPLKVYEYLAMGRPVVSAPMKALQREDAASAIEFAASPAEFSAAIERALTPEEQARAGERRAAALPYSWERLFERLDAACDEALGT